MLRHIIKDNSLTCSGVVGFWRANSNQDDMELYDDNGDIKEKFYGLRQQVSHELVHPQMCGNPVVFPSSCNIANCSIALSNRVYLQLTCRHGHGTRPNPVYP